MPVVLVDLDPDDPLTKYKTEKSTELALQMALAVHEDDVTTVQTKSEIILIDIASFCAEQGFSPMR